MNAHWNVGNAGEITGSSYEADRVWLFWAGTWDGTNIENFYIDGVSIGQSTGNGNANGSGNSFVIGSAPDYTGRNFGGSISQVAVFPTALSQAQVQQLYFSVGTLAPIIVQQPQNSVVIVNSNVTFSVTHRRASTAGLSVVQQFRPHSGSHQQYADVEQRAGFRQRRGIFLSTCRIQTSCPHLVKRLYSTS